MISKGRIFLVTMTIPSTSCTHKDNDPEGIILGIGLVGMKHRAGGNVGGGGGSAGKDMVLPLTQADLLNGTTTAAASAAALTHRAAGVRPAGGAVRVRRVRKKKSTHGGGGGGGAMWGFGTLLSFILAAGLLTAFIQRHAVMIVENHGTPSTTTRKKTSGDGDDDDDDAIRETVERFIQEERKTADNLPLKDFPSLQYALHHSDLVLLYFAASWCPMSTPITKLVHELFSPILLLPPPPPSGEEDVERDLEQHQQMKEEEKHGRLSLVYISSDLTQEDMANYKKPNWMAVPFENTRERADIKRHFKTCAKREMEELHMLATRRQHEIPTIIVLSGATQQVLTFHGIKDIQQQAAILAAGQQDRAAKMTDETTTDEASSASDIAKSLVDSWMELNRLSTSLTDKFEIDY